MMPMDGPTNGNGSPARFQNEKTAPQGSISATVSGLWWDDPETGYSGQFTVEVEYEPDEWIVYPESLVEFLRKYSGSELRPELLIQEIWTELAEVLFGREADAEGNLFVQITASTPADEYIIQIGGIN